MSGYKGLTGNSGNRAIIRMHDDCAVFLADDRDGDAWDGFLLAETGGNPFATFAWRGVLRGAFGIEPLFLVARNYKDNAQWDGCLACYTNRDWTGQRHLYGVRQGLIVRQPAAAEALVAAARKLAMTRRCRDMDLQSGASLGTATDGHYARTTFRLALDGDAAVMWRMFRDKTRNMIRRAEKDGVAVRELQHEQSSFDLLARHAECNLLPKGVAVPDAGYFAEVCRHHGARAHILAGWLGTRPIASMLIVRHGKHAAYPVQNVEPAHRQLAVVPMLTWHAMQLAASHGCCWLDMGESRSGSPVYLAKRNFGGVPATVYGLRQVIGGRAFRPAIAALSAIDATILHHAPFAARRRYGHWRVRRGRVV